MLRVGIAQIDIKLGDRNANYKNVETWMGKYFKPSETETLIVLPEIWDVGYAIEEAEKYADPEGLQAAKFLGELAKKYNVWFAAGSVLAGTQEGSV
ncbi:MAG: nitrilase-related carbon-nitrogen hydrolase, partial [Synergistaceae bacterium]|nr:nitrilase-related carbon-nitrogen hydrolase [Synergistaceae bacterium]